jgi:hypothetical protein
MKTFFNLSIPYRFEWNDIRCAATLLNITLIMLFGLSTAWFGLFIAAVGLVKDFTSERRINGILMHLGGVVLNIYFLSLYYGAH